MIPGRQPIHTVFGGAHLFRADVARRFGALALEALDSFAPDADAFAETFALQQGPHAARVLARVRGKLTGEPVEDYRIDFEDGYGVRTDLEEDGHAVAAGREIAAGLAAGTLPRGIGIRVKSLNAAERERSVRTLQLVLQTLVREAGRVPEGFTVTLPKLSDPREVSEFVGILAACERELGMPAGALRLEVMIETPRIVMDADGRSPLPRVMAAAGERLACAVFGAYDFTAALGVTAAHQGPAHPACAAARNAMLLAFAGSGVRLSDGATAVLPVAVHRAAEGATLTAAQETENRRGVRAAWRTHGENIRSAMVTGFYQGWDLHPAQLVSRHAVTFSFFLEGLDAAGTRLKNFIARSARATRVGTAFDDAATGRGLVNYFRRGVGCGALTSGEVEAACGLSPAELEGMVF